MSEYVRVFSVMNLSVVSRYLNLHKVLNYGCTCDHLALMWRISLQKIAIFMGSEQARAPEGIQIPCRFTMTERLGSQVKCSRRFAAHQLEKYMSFPWKYKSSSFLLPNAHCAMFHNVPNNVMFGTCEVSCCFGSEAIC